MDRHMVHYTYLITDEFGDIRIFTITTETYNEADNVVMA